MKWILYDMGNSSEYFLTPSLRWEHVVVVSIQVGCQGWGVIFMSLVFFMFQSIQNIFEYLKKIIIFMDGGDPPPHLLKNPQN